ncbi:MAG: PAS domain-containing protein [Rhodanobacteraceae bacterium]|nr:PAS domain-containing protein [Rhodanobacteraceae bacterium]
MCRCLLVLLLWHAGALWAATSASVRFTTYGPSAGLSQGSAIDILEDRQGFLWIGTQDGLNRFDGNDFRIFRHAAGDPATLSDNVVLGLAEGADGSIWAATQNGLNRLDPARGGFERFDNSAAGGSLRDTVVIGVHAAADGSIYASTRRGGVQRLDPASRQFQAVPGMPPFVTRQKLLHLHADGRLLVSCDAELWEVDPAGATARKLMAQPLPAPNVAQVGIPRPGGGYAIGTTQAGLMLLDKDGRVERQLRADSSGQALPDDAVRSLLFDSLGRLWIGTARGLARLESDGSVSTWRHRAGDPQALPGDRVVALRSDRQGLLWIGTFTGGVSRFDPETERFRVLRHGDQTGLPANAVATVSAAADGSLWLGMVDRGGLVQIGSDGRVRRSLRRDSGGDQALSADDVTSVLAERGGAWVGYARGGLDWLGGDGSTLRIPTGIGSHALPPNPVQALLRDSDGNLWIGQLDAGLFSLCDGCADLHPWPADLAGKTGPVGNGIHAILQTRDGRLWFAVRSGGLSWFDRKSGEWDALTTASPGALALPHGSVTALLEDAAGTLWIGTQGGGLSRVERDATGRPVALKTWAEAQGLASAMIGSILDGGDGQLWISTIRGLCRFAIEAEQFTCLGNRDPALAGDFFVNSAARDVAGGLHFGGSQGLVSIADPGKVHFDRRPAPLQLTELRIDNRPVLQVGEDSPLSEPIEHAQRIRLQYDQDLISIEFAALDLRRAKALGYRYRLLGRDSEWIDTDASRRVATYTGLPSGKYQFEVEAHDDDELVGRRTLTVEVLPAPWLGPWARLGYALLLGAMIALAAWRYRVRLREREGTRDALAQSEAMLKYALWGSRGELWDADLRSGKLIRRNRLEHLEVSRRATAESLEAYTPFVHADDRTRFRDALVASVKGTQDLFECSYRSADIEGKWRWLLSRGRVFSRDAQGRAIRMVGTTFDITELRANEEALRSSEDRLNLALWGSGDEMWDMDLVNGHIRRENRLLGTELGSETQFPRLIDYMEYVHPADQGPLRDALIAHIKGAVDHFECSYRTRVSGGGWMWLLGKGRVLVRDANGKALRMVGTNRDISRLKQVEDDLRSLNEELELRVQRRTEALESANVELKRTLDQLTRTQRQLVESEKLAALGGLVAGVAHEINTPLGVGVTAASHLQQETVRLARLIEEARMTRADLDHFLEQAQMSSDLVLRNLDRASQLVRSFKQVAVDQSSEQRRAFRLSEYLAEILLSLHPRIKKQKTQVDIECPDDLVLDTYPGALYQIIVNLVINSLVHAFDEQQGGRIQISAQREGDDVILDFRDDGKGMSEQVQKRVFEPFFTTRRGSGGSGLGLHIVYNLATQVLGGSVSCDSAPGKGTHFRIVVPRLAPRLAGADGVPDGGAG